MKLAIYLAAIPKNKNALKLEILQKFAEGATKAGDHVTLISDHTIISSDLAIMQGFVHHDVSSPHLQLRKRILDTNKNTLVIDSNLFQFANKELANYYLRYSLNGIFPTTGFYFDNIIDPSRWRSISNRLNIQLKDYRTNGNHILICLQRVDGWSMCGTSVQQWLDNTVAEIRKYSNRPIIVRKHPGDRKQDNLRFPKDCILSNSVNLLEDLNNCWAMVTFNSSPGIAGLILGVPVFVTDIAPQRSQTWPICNTSLSLIETPTLFDRTAWLNRISQCHWNLDEVSSGQAWSFLRERFQLLLTTTPI
jgi:hypothetical protein